MFAKIALAYFATDADDDGKATGERFYVFETEADRNRFVKNEGEFIYDEDDIPRRVAIEGYDIKDMLNTDFGRLTWIPCSNGGFAFTFEEI